MKNMFAGIILLVGYIGSAPIPTNLHFVRLLLTVTTHVPALEQAGSKYIFRRSTIVYEVVLAGAIRIELMETQRVFMGSKPTALPLGYAPIFYNFLLNSLNNAFVIFYLYFYYTSLII